jgi:tight adherence protein B
MAPALLILLGGLLLLSLLLATLALVRSGSGHELRARVQGVSRPSNATAVLPGIRRSRPTEGRLRLRLFRALNYHPDIPQEQVIAWPLVALLGMVATGLAAACLHSIAGAALALGTAPLVGLLVVRWVFGWQHRRYCDAIFLQIPESLGLMVRAIRAGLPLAEAIRNISTEMPAPTRDEFARVAGDMAIGRPVEAALARLHDRTGLTEYAFLAVTLGLQSQTGGSLAETLENLAEMVRKRVAMAKRAKALAGEAKAQAGLLVVLPFLAALGMSLIQPFYIQAFTQNPAGQRMAIVGLGLMLLGLLTIRWLIRQAGRD